MGFKLTERVFQLDRKQTTASEQAVLVALAFRANDATLECRPKQETLAQMTHLSRSTVAAALNTLRERGFLRWIQGGLASKKGRYGQTLANEYKLDLTKFPAQKPVLNVVNDTDNAEPSVRQPDTPVSDSRTHQCPIAGHSSVRQPDTNRRIYNRRY